jgi:GTP-binding protein SAR1
MFFSTDRTLWKNYFAFVDVVVFFIDADDPKRFPESKDTLYWILEDKDLECCPVLTFGNKMDRPRAVCEEELRSYFELQNTSGKVFFR